MLVYLYRTNKDNEIMNTSKFYNLLKEANVNYDGDLAFIRINEQGVLIDVYMCSDDTELQIEECNVSLTEKERRALQLKIEKFVNEANEQEEDNFNGVFSEEDYAHFENLIHA